MDREVPGFIANRLQEALWREALHMVANGEATVEQIDASITEGPGLRWAFHGPMLTFHLAGGPGGMAHMLDHFGPSLLSPWTRLAAPDLTPELRDRVVRGCAEEAGSRSIADLVRERDRALVDLLRVLGQGEPAAMPEPLTWAEDVRPEWIDYNGHLSEAYYVLVFGHAHGRGDGRARHDVGVPGRDGARRSSRSRRTSATSTRCPPDARLDVRYVGDRRDRQAAVALARDVVRGPAAGDRGGAHGARRHGRRAGEPVPRRPAGAAPRRCWCRRRSTRPAASPWGDRGGS